MIPKDLTSSDVRTCALGRQRFLRSWSGFNIYMWRSNCVRAWLLISVYIKELGRRRWKNIEQQSSRLIESWWYLLEVEWIRNLLKQKHLSVSIRGIIRLLRFYLTLEGSSWTKTRFFGWLILHQKTLTAQNLLQRYWPCNWICCLCTSAFEDTNHLCSKCPSVRHVWSMVCAWENLALNNGVPLDGISKWWSAIDCVGSKDQKKAAREAMLTTWWNVWLERNKRVFNNIRERSCLYGKARRGPS